MSLLLSTYFGSPDQPSSGRWRIHKRDIKGDRLLFTLVQIITILLKKTGIIRLKLMYSCVTEFLKYNQCDTVIKMRWKQDKVWQKNKRIEVLEKPSQSVFFLEQYLALYLHWRKFWRLDLQSTWNVTLEWYRLWNSFPFTWKHKRFKNKRCHSRVPFQDYHKRRRQNYLNIRTTLDIALKI